MNAPAEIIRREVARCGVLSFARFMELALYCPNSGYYEREKDNLGRRGDFYTSVSTGELFGRLLAFQFANWLEELLALNPQLATVSIVEAGAHDGQLASDILTWLQQSRRRLFEQIEYDIVEPSVRQQGWQRETLKGFAPHVRWFSNFPELARRGSVASEPPSKRTRISGVIFANELLDAMPVHRLGWDAKNKKWFEWGVTLENGKFAWAKIETLTTGPGLPDPALCEVLPDGYTIETSPAAENWWREAANILKFGRLLTVDYGLTADELFSPGQPGGTLRAYSRHHTTGDVLANPGEQDLTAHVNFSTIQSTGEACGLQTEIFSTQAQFLTKVVEKIFKTPELFGGWSAKQGRQFQTLTHPEHLGHAFRVLIQARLAAICRPASA